MPERIDSKFRYVLLAAARAEQMIHNATSSPEGSKKVTRAAMNEITADTIEWDYGPAPEPEPEEGAEGEAAESGESKE